MEAIELLKNKFGVSQKYLYELKDGEETILEIYWNPLTIAERETIVAKSGDSGTNDDFALKFMKMQKINHEQENAKSGTLK
jgi:hypothetical protein